MLQNKSSLNFFERVQRITYGISLKLYTFNLDRFKNPQFLISNLFFHA